jgi:hypothetical protein
VFEEQKRPATSFRNPSPGRSIIFVGKDGLPATKQENGGVGKIAAGDGFAIQWKDDIVGNPYMPGDEVPARLGSMVMIFSGWDGVGPEPDPYAGGYLSLMFPPASTPGAEFMICNLQISNEVIPLPPLLVPGPGDRIGSNQVGEICVSSFPGMQTYASDGLGRWSMVRVGYDIFFVPLP